MVTDGKANTLIVVLSLYVFSHRPVRLLSHRGLGLLWLFYLSLYLPLLFFRRILLGFPSARGQAAQRNGRSREDEKGC